MKSTQENIISIRCRNIQMADKAFSEFMGKVENCLNNKASNLRMFKNCAGTRMETEALKVMKEIAPSTPFRQEEIKLVSGAKFPDIQAEKYYGVEVKTTLKDNWKSVGSSIVESTRIEDVKNIYMLFGKLGGEIAEFKCKPYAQCLENIALTHQPRYLINMQLKESQQQNIFEKMNVYYDDFRLLEESQKVAKVRQYFRAIAQKDSELPWWIATDENEECASSPIMIRFLNDLGKKEKQEITAKIFVLFPEIFGNDPSKYKRCALWMCSRHSLICSNIRDFFTAGGQIRSVGNKTFSNDKPQIINRLYQCYNEINSLLNSPNDQAFCDDIEEMWAVHCNANDYENYWFDKMQQYFESNKDLCDINLRDLVAEW